jgi:hypothetical protein
MPESTPFVEYDLETVRKMTPRQKLMIVFEMYQAVREHHAAIVRRRNPTATSQEIANDWMFITLEPQLFAEVQEHLKRQKTEASSNAAPAENSEPMHPFVGGTAIETRSEGLARRSRGQRRTFLRSFLRNVALQRCGGR